MALLHYLTTCYSLQVQPGKKHLCPCCGHRSFMVKRDISVSKCFYPGCGVFMIQHKDGSIYDSSLKRPAA